MVQMVKEGRVRVSCDFDGLISDDNGLVSDLHFPMSEILAVLAIVPYYL